MAPSGRGPRRCALERVMKVAAALPRTSGRLGRPASTTASGGVARACRPEAGVSRGQRVGLHVLERVQQGHELADLRVLRLVQQEHETCPALAGQERGLQQQRPDVAHRVACAAARVRVDGASSVLELPVGRPVAQADRGHDPQHREDAAGRAVGRALRGDHAAEHPREPRDEAPSGGDGERGDPHPSASSHCASSPRRTVLPMPRMPSTRRACS
jgi:hypothetical protein